MGERDPREILGLSNGALEDDLKSAYRTLALRYHPDRNRGDETAAAKFREVSEAYAALRQGWGCPGTSREGMAAGASRGFAFAGDAAFEFAFPSGTDTAPCPSPQIRLPVVGTAGRGTPDHTSASGGHAARRGAGLSAPLCLVLGGVLIGVALPRPGPAVGALGPVRTAPLASSASALALAADRVGFLTRAEAPVAGVSVDHAAALWDSVAAERVLAQLEEPARGQNVAWAEGDPAGQEAASAEHPSDVPFARPGPLPALAGTGTPTAADRAAPSGTTAKAAALFAALMRHGEKAMELSDVVGARAQYERAAALDPASSTAAIAAGETYDPHVLWLAGVTHPWLTDPAKASVWYERARALGDPAAIGLLTRLR